MIIAKSFDQTASLSCTPSDRSARPRDSLHAAVRELVAQLDQLLDESPQAEATADTPILWEGSGFVYVEATLPGIGRTEIDINIHNGRLFARIETPACRGRPHRSGCREAL